MGILEHLDNDDHRAKKSWVVLSGGGVGGCEYRIMKNLRQIREVVAGDPKPDFRIYYELLHFIHGYGCLLAPA